MYDKNNTSAYTICNNIIQLNKMKRNNNIQCLVNKVEAEYIQAMANKHELTVSEYIRAVILKPIYEPIKQPNND